MSEVEKSAESMHKKELAAMEEQSEEKNNDEIRKIVEELRCGIEITRKYQNIIMYNFEDTKPNPYKLGYIYNITQTHGYVMFDRLLALEKLADKLVDKVLGIN